ASNFKLQVKAKTITEIHTEAEKNLGLRPGATANMRAARSASALGGPLSPTGPFPMNRPGTGGMMPGMPRTRRMPGMPGLDTDNWEVPRSKSMTKGNNASVFQNPSLNKLLPKGSGGSTSGKTSALLSGALNLPPQNTVPLKSLNTVSTVTPPSEKPLGAPKQDPDELHKKTVALLEEYFHIRILEEALQCVEELNSPEHHPEVVKEAINLALDKGSACIDPLVGLLQFLFAKNVLELRDLGTGCLLYGSMLDDISIDLPKAPVYFGEVMGKLILADGLSFKVVEEILKKVEDERFREAIFDAVVKSIEANPSGLVIMSSQSTELEACKNLLAF
ncbi:eukaryotic translation initiation factor-like, partial [Ananas comosus]|uniref:Eukaryotic translation initiation factor-like n=1 Tax=Ananas comosus TaxID=4615 RepID=A0A6P5EGH9_ANACO